MEGNNFKCVFCEKTYKSKKNVKRHIRVSHDKGFDRIKHIKCPGCEETFRYRKDLRCHVSSDHGVPMEMEEYTFTNLKHFELWKEEIEKKMTCSYVKRQSTKLVQSKEKHQYDCHRSGCYSGKATRKRELKSVGTKKINAFCPSSMDVIVTPTEVQVKFYKSHYGHKNELGHVFLSREDRVKIAEKMKQGVSFQHILDEIRDSFSGEEVNRLDLLSNKDLHNIAKRFGVSKKDQLHSTDCSSVKSWVELMKCAQFDSPIIYYKEQGDVDRKGILDVIDFQLIVMAKFQEDVLKKCGHLKLCVDSTLGTNSYDFQLIMLLTIDETGCGCPVSFCFTNRFDEVGVEVFFNAVKERVGIIHANVFMSHDAPAFYNAWCKVMGPACHQLLCSWHVDSNWRKNLQKIHGTPEKKVEVYQTLGMLLQETDKEKFDLLHSRFTTALLADEDTKKFGGYFQKFYADRYKMWALCYRAHLGLNTNEQLESVHKKIKSYYLEGKSSKRIDNTLSMLLKISREECFKRLIKIPEEVCNMKLKQSKQNHINSNEILESMITAIEKNHWLIKCSTDDSSSYDVRKIDDAICVNNCKLTCDKCNVCIHMYECTCLDNFVRCIICEHIHACASNPVPVIESDVDDPPDMCANDDSCSSSDFDDALEKKTDRLKQELKSKTLSEDVRTSINKYLDRCLSLCAKSKADRVKEPPNKKIKPQIIAIQNVQTPAKPSSQKPTILFVSRPTPPQATSTPKKPEPPAKTPTIPKQTILLLPRPLIPPANLRNISTVGNSSALSKILLQINHSKTGSFVVETKKTGK